MTHDPRGGIGYRQLTASDPEEESLRVAWRKAREQLREMGDPDTGPDRQAFNYANYRLTSFLWDRAKADIEADRRKHPKAKRNQPVPLRDGPPNRYLP